VLAAKYGFKLAAVKVRRCNRCRSRGRAKGDTVDGAGGRYPRAHVMDSAGKVSGLGRRTRTPWQLGAVFASPKALTNGRRCDKVSPHLDSRADREYQRWGT